MKKLILSLLTLLCCSMIQAADKYVVAGSSSVFGSNWDNTDESNLMTLVDGVYKLEKSVSTNADIEFKVVKNSTWSTAWPSSNYTISVTAGTILVITYNPTDNVVSAYNLGGYVAAHGTMTSSSWATVQFTASTDKNTASHTYSLTAGNYSFGMRVGGSGNWTSNGSSFTRADASKVITSGSGNCKLTADLDGDYTFTWTYATNTLTITYPDLPEQSVDFDGLDDEILKGTNVTFAATSTGITNPGYRYYVKEKGGSYGSAVTSYNFNTVGDYTVKVEALENNAGAAVAVKETNVEVYETYTFTSGTTIYVDFTDVSGDKKGVNYTYNNSANLNYDAAGAGTTKTITFASNVTWSTLNPFIKTEKASWAGLKFRAPAANQNVAKVAADGASYYWTLTPSVEFSGLEDSYFTSDEATIVATTNVSNPVYTYQVKIGDGAYQSLASNPYTFAAAGTYTFKVSVTGDEGNAEATKVVTVADPLTLYFINKDGWSAVKAYFFTPQKTTWPGDAMTKTALTTDRNNYEVYSFTVAEGAHANVIFNNDSGSQTANLTINATKPYFYNGEWYATLAECDQPDLTTNFYLAGSFNGWNTTADRFMKASEDATEASVTITVNEYSNITFKVMEGSGYCGSSDEITKDDNTATIAAAGSGDDIAMTPYAAGDYVFTLNLSTRVLTVTYPDGEAMPIPKNIFLAGGINSWEPADADYKFSVDEANDIATLELDLEEETDFEFKLVYNSTWMGANYEFKYYWCTDIVFSGVENSNAKLYTFKAGTYTFRYKLSTSELSIVYPATDATTVHVSQYEYATLYSATAFDVPDNVDAFVVTGTEGIRLTLERIYHIPAETGVLLHAAEGDYNFYEGDGRYMDAVTTNYFKGSLTNETVDNSLVHYVLSYSTEGEVGFFWPYGTGANAGVGSFTNNAGKAYLEMPTQSAGVMARRGYLLTDQEEVYTLLDAAAQTLEQGKFIENGQLLIIHHGQLFNAQGVRVK